MAADGPSHATHLDLAATSKRKSHALRLRTLTRLHHRPLRPIEMCSSTASAAREPMRAMTPGSSMTTVAAVTTTDGHHARRNSCFRSLSQLTNASPGHLIITGPLK